MGVIEHMETGRRVVLRARTLLGRSSECAVRLVSPHASGVHALITWTGAGWSLRDLGSRNGTTVGGRRIQAPDDQAIHAGTTIGFGRVQAGWTMVDDGPPVALARSSDRVVQATMSSLDLGDRHWIILGDDDAWRLEEEDEIREVRDGDVIVVDGVEWTLELPERVVGTLDSGAPLHLSEFVFHFAVSRDEEHVALTLVSPTRRVDLGARAHNYLLLTLARVRAEDDEGPESGRGWVHREELLSMLRMKPNTLYSHVLRARRELVEAGIDGAAQVFERRRDSHTLRLGVHRVEIETV